MLAKRIIPCLDVTGGRVVKGVNFVRPARRRRSGGTRRALQRARRRRAGLSRYHRLQRRARHHGRRGRAHRSQGLHPADRRRRHPIGRRCAKILHSGADKVSVNTAAVRRPNLIRELSEEFGAQAVVLAIDARRKPNASWNVFTRGGRDDEGMDAVEWALEGEMLGAGEILLTSMDTDGVQGGFDCELTRAVSKVTHIPLIASGGAGQTGRLRARPDRRPSRRRAGRFYLSLRHLHRWRSQEVPGRARRSCPAGAMIIPCIDLMGGKVVQLVQGREKALEGGTPLEMLQRFAAFPRDSSHRSRRRDGQRLERAI